MNAGLARALGVMMKLDFQRAVLNRVPEMETHKERYFRQVLFICDEYQHFATVGENEPTGDEKFFSLSRQPRCIPIVATQSISSLKSSLPGDTWRSLLQTFRTKIFLALSDDFSAQTASELCGKEDRLKVSYNFSESGHVFRAARPWRNLMLGFETILPFLRPIEHLILDDSISEIMVNGSTHVFIERAGVLQEVPDITLSEKSLMVAVKNIARRLGDDISEQKPILDSRLPVLRRVLNVAVRKRLLLANPCSGVEFRVPVKGLFWPNYVSWSEQKQIELHAQPHLRNIVRIITETGLRAYMELMSMKKDQARPSKCSCLDSGPQDSERNR